MDQIKTVLDLARGELSVSEFPPGSNNVKYNTVYYGRVVSGTGYPWCCVFIWWLFKQAKLSKLFYGGEKTASCGALETYGRAHGLRITSGYRAGDLVFMRFTQPVIEHIGIVESVRADGALVTIEGNTGVGDESNGGQVQRRTRERKYVVSGYRPKYANEEDEEVTQEQFNAMMDVWMQKKAAEGPAVYSQAARIWATNNKIVQGDNQGNMQYKSFCTREQMLVFLFRYYQKYGG